VQRLSLQLVHGLSAFHSKLSALSQSSKSAFFPKALQRNCGGRRFNANKKHHLDRGLYTNVDNSNNNNNYHPSVGRHIILVKLKHSLIWRDLSRVSLPPKRFCRLHTPHDSVATYTFSSEFSSHFAFLLRSRSLLHSPWKA
jgi:hypothetical protein